MPCRDQPPLASQARGNAGLPPTAVTADIRSTARQHPASPARHAAARPFRPQAEPKLQAPRSAASPAALTRSLFTEPVTSSSFRCRLNLGGMIPAGGGGREERLEDEHGPSVGCGPGRRQMAAATGTGLRHRPLCAPPRAERSTAGGRGVACSGGRGLRDARRRGPGSAARLAACGPTPRPTAPNVPQRGNFHLPAPACCLSVLLHLLFLPPLQLTKARCGTPVPGSRAAPS